MPTKSDFQLKAGAVITFFGSSKAYTNANLTNEVAIRYLSLNSDNAKMFSFLPSDWEERVANYSKNGTTDNADTTDVAVAISERDAKIAELEAEITTLKIDKATAETERDNLREELSLANKSLSESLAEVDKLKASKTATRSKKTKDAEVEDTNSVSESSDQSLDLDE